MNNITEWLERFWNRHIKDYFPYPDECFDCDMDNCSGCKKENQSHAR